MFLRENKVLIRWSIKSVRDL